MATKKTSKKPVQQPVLVTINPKWQLAFVIAMVATIGIPAVLTVRSLIRLPDQAGGLNNAFLSAQVLFPFAFVAIGYLFAMVKVRGVLPRLFWAVFLATIGISLYYALQMPLTYFNNVFNLYSTGPVNNWWGSTGWIWTQMGIALALYSLILGILAKRAKRS